MQKEDHMTSENKPPRSPKLPLLNEPFKFDPKDNGHTLIFAGIRI